MRRLRRFLMPAVVTFMAPLVVGCMPARATTFYVSTDGDDGGPGTAARPFRSPQKALDVAQAGDTAHLRPGVYLCRVEFPRSGRPGKPITLEGEPGAVIDGGDIVRGWTPAPEMGPGAYQNPAMPYKARMVSWNNKVVMVMLDQTDSPQVGTIPEALAKPARDNGGVTVDRRRLEDWWTGVEAIYACRDGKHYFRFRDGMNPDDEDVKFVRENSSVVLAKNKRRLVIQGLTIRNAHWGVNLDGASDCVVQDCFLYATAKAEVMITNGGARNHIRNNELTYNHVYGDYGHPWQTPMARYLWVFKKGSSFGDESGIRLEGHGDDNQVYGNHVFRQFDGIVHKPGGKRTRVYNNILQNIHDDALAPEGQEIDAQWHDNVIIEGGNACITFWEEPHRQMLQGPLYIYRNRAHFTTTGHNGEVIHFKNCSAPTGRVYIYHNSACGAAASVSVNGAHRGRPPSPNIILLNNVFSSARFYRDCRAPQQRGVGHFDYNWCGGDNADYLAGYPNFGGHNVVAKDQSLWPDRSDPSFLLAHDSPARGKGIDLSKPFEVFGRQHPALPGFKPGYFQGDAPDLGAIQYGYKPPIPAAPSGLKAMAGPEGVRLSWQDNADNETGFLVDRGEDGEIFTTVARVPPDTRQYVDWTAEPGTAYHYRIWAIQVADGAWYSPYSNVATVAGREALPGH